ncbi:MAG: NADH-quinone oxidoreductase subunit NuoK [Dehalococcoidia bacterium]
MSVSLGHYLAVSAVLFGLGLWIALSKRNAIIILMGIELMLNAVNLTLVAFNRFGAPAAGAPMLAGHVFVLFVIAVAAAEAAVALALIVSVYRTRSTVDIDRINLLKF